MIFREFHSQELNELLISTPYGQFKLNVKMIPCPIYLATSNFLSHFSNSENFICKKVKNEQKKTISFLCATMAFNYFGYMNDAHIFLCRFLTFVTFCNQLKIVVNLNFY